MKKVCVLMTTYNPKKYVLDQVESILNQKEVSIMLIIRDDASTNTEWLDRIPKSDNIMIIHGDNNVGVARNIMALIKYAYDNAKEFDFFAYSDQDDVWMDDKLIVAVNSLNELNLNMPCLYYSNLLVVDDKLSNGFNMFKEGVVKNTLSQALAQIFNFACTSVFNYKMIEELISQPIEYMGFDHLLYYIGIIKGCILYDDTPHILYRQHGDNVSGVKQKGLKYYVNKVKSLCKKKEDYARAGGGNFKDMSKYIKKYFYNNLSNNDKEIVNKVASYGGMKSRLSIIFDKRIKAGYMPKDLYGSIRLIFGKY